MSEKLLRTKIIKLEAKNAALKQKICFSNLALRLEKSRRKEVEQSRFVWRFRAKDAVKRLQEYVKPVEDKAIKSDTIQGHQYKTLMVSLCVSIYLSGNCGFRSTVKIVSALCLITGLELGRIPSKSSIENWIKKIGYDLYTCSEVRYKSVEYGLIVDESMVIGQERLLVILGIEAEKTAPDALRLTDVTVLFMGVRPSWTGVGIAEEIKKVMEKEGKNALYVISDKGSTMCKGIRDAGLVRISDVGHEIARLIEKRYDSDLLTAFTTEAKQSKAKLIMTPLSYLLCPKQRNIARFMNLSTSVNWGKDTLHNFAKLNTVEQVSFEWLKKHAPIIDELSIVFEQTQKMLKIVKNEGLSYKTIGLCLDICHQVLPEPSLIFTQLMIDIELYLKTEQEKLPDEYTSWQASSDIIESLFGTYKARKATNPLHGVTSSILFLPIMTKLDTDNNTLNIDVKEALESVFIADLNTWNTTYMIENQVVKRKKLFKK